MSMEDLSGRMKERRAPLPALRRTGLSAEWLMGGGTVMVIVGVILVATRMGKTFETVDYGCAPHIAIVGVALILRGMFRTFRTRG